MELKKNVESNDSSRLNPRILVISALPIDKSSSTRAFFTYLHKIGKGNIAQIYTNISSPKDFSLCDNFYQINDSELLKKKFNKKLTIGKTYTASQHNAITPSKSIKRLVSFGKKDYAFTDLLRNILWQKQHYLNNKMKLWLKQFNPDIIFFHNSNALFMENMCLAIYEYIKKPIVMEISDDYFFSKKKSISPLYYLRRMKYKKIFTKILNTSSQQIYISDKMRDKYNSYFSKDGKTVHIASMNKKINIDTLHSTSFKIGYFGNLGLGRKKSISQIGKALSKISSSITIDVYSPKLGNSKSSNKSNKVIRYCGFLPYQEVEKQIKQYDLLLFVESFKKRIVEDTRYSLSTKIGDYLSSSVPIYAYGPKESGSIQYLTDNKCAFICLCRQDIDKSIKTALNDKKSRNIILDNAKNIVKTDFDLEYNSNVCNEIFKSLL